MKILFVQHRPLFPANTGGRIRTLNVLKYLASRHEITYVCSAGEADQESVAAMQALNLRMVVAAWKEVVGGTLPFYRKLALNVLSPFPFSVAKDYNPALRRKIAQLVAHVAFDLVICDFVQTAPYISNLPCRRSLLFQHNVEAEIFSRHAAADRGLLRRSVMAWQARKMRRFEAEAGAGFDAVVAVSERDRDFFEREYGWSQVRLIDTAVDVGYFRPRESGGDGLRVVFVGAMDWLPNQDGVRFFVERIWPGIRSAHPAAEFDVVGRNPPAGVQRLERVEGVRVLGTVPDVRPYLAEAAVVVVPLLVGGGTRIKIFEAMAMARPVVSTSVGAEGLQVVPGEHLLLCDSPERFSGEVIRLLSDAELRRRIGESGRALVCRRYTAESVAKQFEQRCDEILQGTDRPSFAGAP